MITLKNISKTFQQKGGLLKALDDVSLEVAKGDIVGIIGSSGAGKSTLIRCVNLLEKPDSGQVFINGTELTKLSASGLAQERKKIGMIFQHFNLLSSRTVFGNVALPLELDKITRLQRNQRVKELLALVGLEDKAQAYPAQLSGGQKQRVAIARALASDPYVLLCDEATSALDPATTQSILQLLRDINERTNITILLITHEMEVVKSICNHIAVIDQGKLVAKGTLEELMSGDSNPVIKQFMPPQTITIPQEIHHIMKAESAAGLSPVIEIALTGNISFEKLIDTIAVYYRIPYKLIKADIEYLGKASFGTLLLHLKGDTADQEKAFRYFIQNNIKHAVHGYA